MPREASPKRAGRRSRYLRWLRDGALLVVAYLAISAWQERKLLGSGPAPALRGSSRDGRPFALEQLRGKAVLLHFWATWCGVCRMEVGSLNGLQRSLPEGTVLVSVVADGADQDRAALDRFVREHAITYPVVLADSDALRAYAVNSFPTNYYIDEEGVIQSVKVGMSSRFAMWLRLWLL